MKFLALVLVFSHLFSQFSFQSSWLDYDCKSRRCSCPVKENIGSWYNIFNFRKVTINCHPYIEVVLTDNSEEAKIRCQRPEAGQSLLSDLRIPSVIERVRIEGCSLPNSSFSVLLNSMGVHKISGIFLTSYSGRLQRNHFENLEKISILNISQNNLGDFSVDIFEELKNLEKLTIHFSYFSIEQGMFGSNTKPAWASDSISEISFDVFDNLTKLSYLEIVGDTKISIIFDESEQFIAPPLDHIIIKSVIIKPQLYTLGRADEQSELHLDDNTTAVLPKRLQEILQSAKMYEIVLNDITTNTLQLQPACFANLTSLKYLTLSGNHLKFVPEDSFSKSINIRKLDLNNNFISSFEPNTFLDLRNLANLNISNNQISHLPEALFYNTKSLAILDLSDNLLERIEPNLFAHLSQLLKLDLSHNNIIFISGEQFSQQQRLWRIDLSHNQLVSLAMDPLLRDLDYSVFYKCTDLSEILLQNNSLSEIYEDWRLRLTELDELDLSYNKITDMQTYDDQLNMNSTHIGQKKITVDDLFRVYFQFPRIGYGKAISNSTLPCNCELLTMLYNKKSNELTKKQKNQLDMTRCKTSERFNKSNPWDEFNWTMEYEKCKQLPPEEIQKFHQGCPEGCRCVYRPFTKSSVINCQNAHLQDYPRTLPVAPDANHTELSLYGNKLQEFSLPDDQGYKNVTFLNLAYNLLSTLDINGVSKKLKKLDLSHNQLKTLSVETLELLEGALELERLELHDNPWICDVSNYRLARLVHDKQHLLSSGRELNWLLTDPLLSVGTLSEIWHNVTCPDGSPILNIIQLFDYKLKQITIYVVSGVVVMLLMTVFILTVLYYRHRQKVHVYCFSSRWKVLRWLVSHPDYDDDDDKLYDAFIIYSQEDELFVVNHLVPYLEETEDRKYKLCLHFRDWIPGEQILIQIGRSVRSSRRAIVVLSPNFLRSVWGVAEFRVAHAEALKNGKARVIVILYQDVSDDEVDKELKAYLQTNTYVRWGSPWFWKQLTYALPHPPDRERAALHYFSRGRRYQEALDSAEYHGMEQ